MANRNVCSARAARSIRLSGEPYTVLGVMDREFRFPSREFELWLPLYVPPDEIQGRADFSHLATARLKPGISIAQAQPDLDAISAQLAREYAQNEGVSAVIAPLLEDTIRGIRTALLLLVGCVNAANLL